MRASRCFAAIGAIALAGACADTTAPATRTPVDIIDIQTPAVAVPTDTVRVRFAYEAGCGDREVVLRFSPSRLDVRVFRVEQAGLVCPALYTTAERTVLIAPSQRDAASDYTVTFAQPSGADSVRIVRLPATIEVSR